MFHGGSGLRRQQDTSSGKFANRGKSARSVLQRRRHDQYIYDLKLTPQLRVKSANSKVIAARQAAYGEIGMQHLNHH